MFVEEWWANWKLMISKISKTHHPTNVPQTKVQYPSSLIRISASSIGGGIFATLRCLCSMWNCSEKGACHSCPKMKPLAGASTAGSGFPGDLGSTGPKYLNASGDLVFVKMVVLHEMLGRWPWIQMDELYFFSGYDLKIAVVVNAHIFGKGNCDKLWCCLIFGMLCLNSLSNTLGRNPAI